ncbi:GNAT family N-acetyltransferase [Erythrobacter sp. sf7]|uniref:GNAT family N-acetyltransferase n=1 Tax=Erythrobacter fulvus TaxID=2987523 RepID=A0ABT5JKZ9_9SPHN|nr:GNAT family N-acetyltransferase [Erythrobacter fulvus]MDC8753228.1 GNAT family N-acetyltransferase [Erythrobacter fulvus]
MDHAVRLFRDTDAEALAELTGAAIRAIGARAYSPKQVAAWAARHPGPERFIASAAKGDTIILAVDAGDTPVAYALFEAAGHLDMLYCHPDHAGRGLAMRLLAEAEKRAIVMGIERLFTEASELARPVFERTGYVMLHRRDFSITHEGRDVPIHNYAMERKLG